MGIEFNKCCFCINLRTGCLIIGYLNLIYNIVFILMAILGLAVAGVITAQGKDEKTLKLGAVVFAVDTILLVILILFLAFNIVLLVGVHQYRRGYVKAYLIFTTIFLVLYLIIIVVFAAFYFNVGMFVGNILSILLSVYFLLVIRSYYLKMDEPSNKPAIYNTAEISQH